jgi:hypothetical protein
VKVELGHEHLIGIMYFLTLQELGQIGLHKDIVIGRELSEITLKKYSEHLHAHVFPHPVPESVTVIVGDGHSKVMAK